MTDYVASALFLYTKESAPLRETIVNNSHGVKVTAVLFDQFEHEGTSMLDGIEHVVISGSLEVIRTVFSQAFLLFSTNLVGIIVAATLTFRVLGYSAVVVCDGYPEYSD